MTVSTNSRTISGASAPIGTTTRSATVAAGAPGWQGPSQATKPARGVEAIHLFVGLAMTSNPGRAYFSVTACVSGKAPKTTPARVVSDGASVTIFDAYAAAVRWACETAIHHYPGAAIFVWTRQQNLVPRWEGTPKLESLTDREWLSVQPHARIHWLPATFPSEHMRAACEAATRAAEAP